MSTHDKIPETGSGRTSDASARTAPGLRKVGPESETRGGPDAPDESLDTRGPGVPPNPGLGHRAALPEGSLPGPYLDAQGDENRKPPDNAPAPVNPAATVADDRKAVGGTGKAGRPD